MSRPVVPLIGALSAARKAIQLYPPAHPTYQEAIGALLDAAATALGEGPFSLNLHEGRLYDGSDVVPGDSPTVASLAEAMEARRIESIVFEAGFAQEDAVGLAQVLNLRPSTELDVQAELESRGVAGVRVSSLTDEEAEERAERDRVRSQDRASYQRLVSTLRALSSQAAGGQPLELAQAGPMVEGILSRLVEDEAAVLGMATINAGSEMDLLHAMNVMIYSLNLGVALGIPEEGLTVMGLSALMHDIGKAAFDRSEPDEARAARVFHPTVGAEILSRIPDEAGTTAMLVAYEHHMGVDGGGFPEHTEDYVAHPYSRIVAIANRFDGLTKRGIDDEPLSPDRAVMRLLDEAGTALDPFFTRLFVRSLGVFPVGCLVRLSDHSVGVVCARGDEPLTPTVRLVFGPDGIRLEAPHDVDLAGDERDVVEVVDPEGLGIAVADYL
jgi:HD-GYP domain-containing protein (c-di-GMP phosphodiesterase class II)